MSTTNEKKRKTGDSDVAVATNGKSKKKKSELKASSSAASTITTSSSNGTDSSDNASFKPLTLAQIRTKIDVLKDRVPIVPTEGIDPSDIEAVREWASTLQAIIEEFNLLLCCVSASTYKWGSDRSGAADQNLGMLSSELGNAQDQITTSITPRLTNVLAPVVELVRHVTLQEDDEKGRKKKIHEFRTQENDPAFVHLCRTILCRNAVMMRCVFLTNVIKVGKCIDDYLKATKKDSSNNRNFSY